MYDDPLTDQAMRAIVHRAVCLSACGITKCALFEDVCCFGKA